MKPIINVILARGHENIQATHRTTFEITKESTLTKSGDCVIATESTRGAADLSPEFMEAARREDTEITITLEVDELKEMIRAKGSPQLLFTHPTDLVVRKTDYTCGRTLAIRADKAAIDLSRKLIEKIRNPKQRIKVTLTVESY